MTSQTQMTVASKNRNLWLWGFTPQAETWNGRFAMIGFVALLLTEFLSGQGVLHFWHLMQTTLPVPPIN
jgi:Chlorophyll A-B binding protein